MKNALLDDHPTATSESLSTDNSAVLLAHMKEEPLSQFHDEEMDHFEEHGSIEPQEIDEFESFHEEEDLFRRMLQEDSYINQTSQINFEEDDPSPIQSEDEPSPSSQTSSNVSAEKLRREWEKEKAKGKAKLIEAEENFYRKFKKNVNMPKAIGRYLMDYYHSFKDTLYKDEASFFQKFVCELEDRKIWVRRSKKNSIKLKDLQHFFGDSSQTRRHSCLNRLMMRKIIQKQSRDEIIPNNQVKGKLEYLVATKVYALRCANAHLSTRMQMR